MENVTSFTQTTTVEAVFKAAPNVGTVFIKHKTDCVGCFLARFCTLGEVADVYELDLQALLDDLQRSHGEYPVL